MLRKALFATLALAPVTIALHYVADLGATTEFVLAALALVPLAWLIGEATEHAAEHTGPGIGGFLNATFGNAPELIIALLAVHEGLNEVVRGSLTGSVVGNLLLVLGFSLLAGGRGEVDRFSSFLSLGLVGLAIVLFVVPAVPSWDGAPERDLIVYLSLAVSIVLLLVYVAATWFSLRRHHEMHTSSDGEIEAWSFPPVTRCPRDRDGGDCLRGRDPRGLDSRVRDRDRSERVLPRGRGRGHRRKCRRARRCGARRLPRQDHARGRDRTRLVRTGRGLPDPRRGAALVADRSAGARVPSGRARRARGLDSAGRDHARRRAVEPAQGDCACSPRMCSSRSPSIWRATAPSDRFSRTSTGAA